MSGRLAKGGWALVVVVAVATATPAPCEEAGADSKRMFATSTSGVGNLSTWAEIDDDPDVETGLVAADEICQRRADAAGLSTAGAPAFRAWASDETDDAYCRVQGLSGKLADNCGVVGDLPGAGPWVRTDGTQFSGDVVELAFGGAPPLRAPFLDESGNPVGLDVPDPIFFGTGTLADGTVCSNTCTNWTDGTNAVSYESLLIRWLTDWTFPGSFACDYPFRLVCFEVGAGPEPPAARQAGALTFLTSVSGTGDLATWLPHSGGVGGLAGADAVCASLAASAKLPLSTRFKAFLSDSTIDAIDRNAIDGPWRRLDGVELAASKADLVDGRLETAMLVKENGAAFTFDDNYAWTGSTAAGEKDPAGFYCADWGSSSNLDSGLLGYTFSTSGEIFNGGFYDCAQTNPGLYCLSDVVTIFWNDFEPGGWDRDWDSGL